MTEQLPVNNAMLSADVTLDVRGLACPMPLLKTKLALNKMQAGQLLGVYATDGGSWRDIPAFIKQVSHELILLEQLDNEFVFLIKKQTT